MVLLLYGPPYFDGHNSNPLTFPIAARFNYPNRRFNFRVHRYANCSYTEDELESNNGWNKIGRISFIRNSNANIFKMHLGWIFRDDPNTIEFSLFYHNNEHKSSGYIAHKIDERHFPDVNAIRKNEENFKVYPNPNTGTFNILAIGNDSMQPFTVEVTDIIGNVIFYKTNITTKVVEVNIQKRNSGMFFVRIIYENQYIVKKIVVN